MTENLFYSSDLNIVLTFLLINLGTAVFLNLLQSNKKTVAVVGEFDGINPSVLSLVGTMFSLSAAFLGSSTWGTWEANNDAVKQERLAIVSYIQILESSPELKASGLNNVLRDYVESAVKDEWPLLNDRKTSEDTNKKFQVLINETVNVAMRPEVGTVFSGFLVRSIEQLKMARHNRLGYRFQTVETTRWYAVIFLGLLTQLVTVLIHGSAQKKTTRIAALGIVTTLTFSIEVLIALSVDAYTGIVSISAEPLMYALQRIN